MAFVTAPSQEKAQELALGIVRQGWQQPVFYPLENFVYGRGLELSENLKRVHSVPYGTYVAKFRDIMKGGN